MYNIDQKELSLHSRLIIPLKSCSLSLGVLAGQNGFAQGLLSVSFHLFKPSSPDSLFTPAHHVQKSNIYYYFHLPMKVNKEKENRFVLTTDIPDQTSEIIHYIEQSEENITLRDKTQEGE